MNRRNFLKQVGGLLAVIPALAWVKEKMPVAETEWPYLYIPPSDEAYGATPDEHWADDFEEELNGEALAISADGTIYVGGAFVNPPISNDEYWARWNGVRFEPIAFEGLDI